MKLPIKPLRAALSDIGRVIKGRSTLPAIQCVKLSCTDGDKLLIEGTNIDAWITRKVDRADGIEPVLVNHSLLCRLLESVVDDSVELLLTGTKLTIKHRSVRVLSTVDAIEFPKRPEGDMVGLAVNAKDFADGLEAVNWAAERDSNADALKLITVVDMQPKMLTCAAYRGTFLAVFNRPSICEMRTLTLPSALVPVIIPALREKGAGIFLTPNFLSVQHDAGSATIKRSEVPPPPHKRLTDMRGLHKGTPVDRETLRRNCHDALAMNDARAMIALPKFSTVKIERDEIGNPDELLISLNGGNGDGEESLIAAGDALNMVVPAEQLDICLSKSNADKVRVITLPNVVFIETGEMLYSIAQCVEKAKPTLGGSRASA